MEFVEDKVIVSDVYIVPDVSWYKPTEMKNSPSNCDRYAQRRKKMGWLPKRVREHPKMQKLFGKPKKTKQRKTTQRIRRIRTKGERFNQIVEQAYKSGKL